MQWRGGSCSFSWVEDYKSLRSFCVLESSEARAAFLGPLETALVGLSEFAPQQNVGVGHLRISESFFPLFVMVGREVQQFYRHCVADKVQSQPYFYRIIQLGKRPLYHVQLFDNTVFPTPTSTGEEKKGNTLLILLSYNEELKIQCSAGALWQPVPPSLLLQPFVLVK